MPGDKGASPGVLDASVAVRWLVDEVGSEEARLVVEAASQWLAPHLLITECASALRRKVISDTLTVPAALAAIAILERSIDDAFITLADDRELVSAALNLALTIDHKVPDCMYLALAEREGIVLATADLALSRAAKERGTVVALVSSTR